LGGSQPSQILPRLVVTPCSVSPSPRLLAYSSRKRLLAAGRVWRCGYSVPIVSP